MWNRVVKWRYRCGGQRGEANWRVFVNKRIAATVKGVVESSIEGEERTVSSGLPGGQYTSHEEAENS